MNLCLINSSFWCALTAVLCLSVCTYSRNGGRGGTGVGLGLGSGRSAPSASSAKFPSGQTTRGAFLAGGGAAAGYAAYTAQKTTWRDRSGMSAFGILALLLGIIGAATIAWFCYMIGVPLWRDRQMRRRSSRGIIENLPLQETPSTATPSP